MSAIHHRTCPLCEAMCGLALAVRGSRVVSVRGDRTDPFSRGYMCPKAIGLAEVHHDPDRLRQPLRRTRQGWEPVPWDEALAEAVDRIGGIQRTYGADSVALYQGNPTLHSYSALLTLPELTTALGTRHVFSTASVDHLPHMLAAYHMFGHKAMLPVPDVDRTDFLLMFGANPVVSNGSLMSAPNMAMRLRRLRERGARLVVVDPRRTQTAALSDVHLAVPPGTDVFLLLSLIWTLLDANRVDFGRLADFVDGIDVMKRAVGPFSPERVASMLALAPQTIRSLAMDFANAPSAVCYGRLGVCTQRYGALCCWLMLALNTLTGNLDRVGGAMFATPAVDLAGLATIFGQRGSFARWRSRVRGLPEFAGELPLAVLAEEIETPGAGQIRGLITVAGNPVLSSVNGGRLDRLLPSLDFMLAIDFYLNETTRHAHVILPTCSPLQRDHYDLVYNALAIRNVARYSPPAVEPDPDAREDGDVLLELARRIHRTKGGRGGLSGTLRCTALRWLTPRRLLALGLRFGPYGAALNPFRVGLSLASLEREGRTVDLGPLTPRRLPERLHTPNKRIALAPAPFIADLARARGHLDAGQGGATGELLLVGRRDVRSNNSWMHNCPSLMKGADRCVLHMHPLDAVRRGFHDGQRVRIRSRVGAVEAPLEINDAVTPGVVSLPHGFGHHRAGTRLSLAQHHSGVSLNDLTDDEQFDELSGTSVLNGLHVTVIAVDA